MLANMRDDMLRLCVTLHAVRKGAAVSFGPAFPNNQWLHSIFVGLIVNLILILIIMWLLFVLSLLVAVIVVLKIAIRVLIILRWLLGTRARPAAKTLAKSI